MNAGIQNPCILHEDLDGSHEASSSYWNGVTLITLIYLLLLDNTDQLPFAKTVNKQQHSHIMRGFLKTNNDFFYSFFKFVDISNGIEKPHFLVGKFNNVCCIPSMKQIIFELTCLQLFLLLYMLLVKSLTEVKWKPLNSVEKRGRKLSFNFMMQSKKIFIRPFQSDINTF